MRIQMIDLLVAIAKGEEIPKMIKYKSKTYSYDELERDYKNYTSTNDWLFESYLITNILFDVVEIIEEPKKIKKLDSILRIDDLIPPYGKNEYKAWENIIIQQNKINELIDEINNLKENK